MICFEIMKERSQHRRNLFLALGLTILVCLGVWLPTSFAVRLSAAMLLLFFLPGWLLLRALRVTAEDRLEQAVLAGGASYGLTALVSLGVVYVSGRLPALWVIGALGVLALALVVISLLRPASSEVAHALASVDIVYFFIPVVVAGFFSFTNLGYSDYWGDEMNGLLRAISVISGRGDVLFEHTKGPVEVILPAVLGLLTGRFEPFTLRFPFALAHTVGVGGYYLLARRLFGRNVGLLAALLLVVNGLYLAFGRIVQYQAVFFLMTGLSLMMAYYFYRGGKGVYLGLSLFLVGVGLLAHYDMLLVLPPIGYLVWRRYGWKGEAWRAEWRQLAGAALVLLLVVGLFYIPFFLHPHLSETSSYLARIVNVANWPANNFDELYVFGVLYNSSYYIVVIVLLGLGALLTGLLRVFLGRVRDKSIWAVTGVAFVLMLLAIANSGALFVPLLISLFLSVLLVGFSPVAAELKLIYAWAAASFIPYVFFVDHPRTHLQIIYPAWSLLAALAARDLVCALKARFPLVYRRGVAIGAVIIGCLLFGLFAAYEYLLFVDIEREYIFTYPEHKSALYWEDDDFPFGSRRLYGAPHRLGWQMINHLYADGTLQGDWNSNDDGSNLFWYTLGWPRNPCYPRYYFLARFEQRDTAREDPPDITLDNYNRIGQIWNRSRLQIDVYEFAPVGGADKPTVWSEPSRYSSFVIPGQFRSDPYEEAWPDISNPLTTPSVFRPGPAALEQVADHYGDPRIVNVRDKVALVGYDLDDNWAKPEGLIVLTLYWQALEPVNLPYKVFAHLESPSAQDSESRLWAQADDFPACGTRPTQHWRVGQVVIDRHIIRLPAEISAGDYMLRVGLYESETGLRMDLLDSLGNPQGTSAELVPVAVRIAN
jgi:4-amino-4-deoxy-L-arabinose transferase-like glycosyltransferase